MRKLLHKPWIVALLACTAVGLVAYQGLDLSRVGSSAQPGPAPEAESDAVELADESGLKGTVDALAAAEMFVGPGTRDPFAPRVSNAPTAEKLSVAAPANLETVKLAAVWLQGDESFVALNARICQVGDVVDGAKIESVTREGAWLRLPSGRQFLPVGREISFVGPQKSDASAPLIVTREY